MFKKLILFIAVAALATAALLEGAHASYYEGEYDSRAVQRLHTPSWQERMEQQVRTQRIRYEEKKHITYSHDDHPQEGYTSSPVLRTVLGSIGDGAYYIIRNRIAVMIVDYGLNALGHNAPNTALMAHGMIFLADVLYNQGMQGNIKKFFTDFFNSESKVDYLKATYFNTGSILYNSSAVVFKALALWQLHEMDSKSISQLSAASREVSRQIGQSSSLLGSLMDSVLGGELARHSSELGNYFWNTSKGYVYKGITFAATAAISSLTDICTKPKENWSLLTKSVTNVANRAISSFQSLTSGIRNYFSS